jgi:hypothetical protein
MDKRDIRGGRGRKFIKIFESVGARRLEVGGCKCLWLGLGVLAWNLESVGNWSPLVENWRLVWNISCRMN